VSNFTNNTKVSNRDSSSSSGTSSGNVTAVFNGSSNLNGFVNGGSVLSQQKDFKYSSINSPQQQQQDSLSSMGSHDVDSWKSKVILF
jgi:hypothetical protein